MIDEENLKFVPAYSDDGKNTGVKRKDYWRKKGVYIIRILGVIRYVGRSGGSLYRGCFRHFQNWCSKPRSTGYKDAFYSKEGAEVCLIETDDDVLTEAYLVNVLNPTDNRERFGISKPKKPKKRLFGRNPEKEFHTSDYDYIRQCEIDNGIFDENY